MERIKAIKKDLDLVAEIDAFRSDPAHLQVWWLGQSGFLLQWRGHRLIFDPYLSDSLTHKYAGTPKPHIRMSERVIDPSLLRDIAVVTSSHNHTDHLDRDTLVPLLEQNPGIHFVIPEANRAFVVERVDCAYDFPLGLSDGDRLEVAPFTIHALPARHNEISRDAQGHCRHLGYVVTVGNRSIYHSGDTLFYEEMVDLLKPFRVDLALLPINGHDPARGVDGNLNAEEAARLGKAIGAGCVIPCHYDLFYFNTADPEAFVHHAQTVEQPYAVLGLGGHWSIPCFS